MTDGRLSAGCGIILAESTPGEVPCGNYDAFGMQQFCHRCNAGIFSGELSKPIGSAAYDDSGDAP